MPRSPIEDLASTAEDVLYVSVGLGMIVFQRLQVRRKELGQTLSAHVVEAGSPLEAVTTLVAERLKMIEERVGAALAALTVRVDDGSGPTPSVRRMRAVVTGGLGFVGQHLDAASARGRATTSPILDHQGEHSVDILDGPAVAARLAALEPEVVYHLAGRADVGASWDDPVGVLRVNAEGTLHVLSACRAAGVARVLAVASADVYGVVTEAELPAHGDLAPPSHQSLRGVEAGRRRAGPAGLPRLRAGSRPGPSLQPPRAPASPSSSWRRRSRPASPAPNGMAPAASRWATSPLAAT